VDWALSSAIIEFREMRRPRKNQTKKYLLIHFWPTKGGYRKRMEIFVNVLQKHHAVERVRTPGAFFRLLLGCKLSSSHTTIIIYISLLAPLIAMLKLLRPNLPVYYMVRGDEITYVKHDRRYFRAFVAVILQRLLNVLGCHFVFVSEDLRLLFEKRLGKIRRSSVLPNTIGKLLPEIRPFDGRVALVGDFDTVKNIEWVIENLSSGKFEVHLFGNRMFPQKWKRPSLHAHGLVEDLTSALRQSASLVVLPDISAGFPNVVIEALEAGCGVVVHREFPFKYLPISNEWRFELNSTGGKNCGSEADPKTKLGSVLERLLKEKRDFKQDNPELIELVESDWEKRVWEIFS